MCKVHESISSFKTNSSNVYAVSRSTEEPPKVTPMLPTATDSNDEVVHRDPALRRPESDQVLSKTFKLLR